jgi:hypothetical protein
VHNSCPNPSRLLKLLGLYDLSRLAKLAGNRTQRRSGAVAQYHPSYGHRSADAQGCSNIGGGAGLCSIASAEASAIVLVQ